MIRAACGQHAVVRDLRLSRTRIRTDMRTPRASFHFAAIIPLLLAAAVAAQEPTSMVGFAAGASFDDDLTPGLSLNTALEPGWLLGANGEWYPGGGRLGVRAATLLGRRGLDEGDGTYTVITGELGLVVRAGALPALGYISPFIALTGGGTLYAAAQDSPVFGRGQFGDDPVGRVHLSPSIGFDNALSTRVGIRLEAGDRIVFPAVGESPTTQGTPRVHIPFFLAGVQLRFGTPTGAEPPRPVVAAPAAPPDAAGEPAVPSPAPDTAEADATPAGPEEQAGAEPPVPEEAAPPEAAVLYTVQVADLVETATAVRWSERLEARDIPAWRIDQEIQGMAVSRLLVGAASTEEAAGVLADLLDRAFGWPVSVRPVRPDESVPPDALERTRAVLDAAM
jgi:cell division septation protein DedD